MRSNNKVYKLYTQQIKSTKTVKTKLIQINLTSSSLISFIVYDTTVIPMLTKSEEATSNTCLLNFLRSL